MSDKRGTEEISFEEAMKLLEDTVKKLEKGDATLEESMALFTEGMRLSKICSDKITGIESKISKLINDSGESAESEFEVI
ncbi:MAG: exodeoxyribonuclease VII small subunit [Saccharofermentanales bacterium]